MFAFDVEKIMYISGSIKYYLFLKYIEKTLKNKAFTLLNLLL